MDFFGGVWVCGFRYAVFCIVIWYCGFYMAVLYERFCIGGFVWAVFGGRFCMGELFGVELRERAPGMDSGGELQK